MRTTEEMLEAISHRVEVMENLLIELREFQMVLIERMLEEIKHGK
jgi:hypothetical protein